MIYTENLYNAVILENSSSIRMLRVITGYSSGSFIERVLNDCPNVSIELYIGMALQGISKIDHLRYINLSKQNNVKIFYVHKLPNVHQKIIEITGENRKKTTYVGSANFSENGFEKQSEILTTIAEDLEDVFKVVRQQCLSCVDKEVFCYIPLVNSQISEEIVKDREIDHRNVRMKNLLNCDEYLKIPILRKTWRKGVAINAKEPYLDLVGTAYSQFFQGEKEYVVNFRDKKVLIEKYGDFGKRLRFKNIDLREVIRKSLAIQSDEITFKEVENLWILIEKNMLNYRYDMEIIVNIDGSDEYFTLD